MTKLVSYAHKHNRNMRFIAPKEAKLPSWAVDIQDYSEEPMPEIPNMSELASWKADAIRLLGEKVKAEKERDMLRIGFDAACAFIDCHVADPDITEEMCAKYAIFDAVRDEIEKG